MSASAFSVWYMSAIWLIRQRLNILGYIVNSKSFRITMEQSRRHFYHATNAIFVRIVRIATVVHQMKTIIWR